MYVLDFFKCCRRSKIEDYELELSEYPPSHQDIQEQITSIDKDIEKLSKLPESEKQPTPSLGLWYAGGILSGLATLSVATMSWALKKLSASRLAALTPYNFSTIIAPYKYDNITSDALNSCAIASYSTNINPSINPLPIALNCQDVWPGTSTKNLSLCDSRFPVLTQFSLPKLTITLDKLAFWSTFICGTTLGPLNTTQFLNNINYAMNGCNYAWAEYQLFDIKRNSLCPQIENYNQIDTALMVVGLGTGVISLAVAVYLYFNLSASKNRENELSKISKQHKLNFNSETTVDEAIQALNVLKDALRLKLPIEMQLVSEAASGVNI